jgi:phenylalanyl-tRNA synthetase beta chain
MRVPLSWLQDYVDLPDSIDDLVYRLTMSGTEIEDVIRIGEHWEDVTVGRVAQLERPPGSARLHVAKIEVDGGEITAVTAAHNIAIGQKVALVRVGGTIPCDEEGEPFVLQPREMMGITGGAMVLSSRELGMSNEHAGILVLPDDTPTGVPLASILGTTTLDVAVSANRPDEMSIVGVAREVAAVTATTLREPDISEPQDIRKTSEPSAQVRVEDPDLCPRYSALRVDGVRVSPSPEWLVAKLEAAGVRSINNIVDVTNFVMFEMGQPLHAFDYEDLPGATIIVRRARPGERLTTLDHVDRDLPADCLVIADADRPVAIAGVMGSAGSEVSEKTTTILLEAANFDRASVRRTSRQLGLRTEASARFERGVAPELTDLALKRALHLIALVTAGPLTIARHVDVHVTLEGHAAITMSTHEFQRLLGVDVTADRARDALVPFGFSVDVGEDEISARAPYWRRDVEGPADLTEEVARMMGYDTIPESLPGQQTGPASIPSELLWEGAVRETLWAVGVSEAWTDTLTSKESMARLFAALPESDLGALDWTRVIPDPEGVTSMGAAALPMSLVNPQTVDRSVLRITLAHAILDVLGRNLKHTHDRVAFFEIARTFFPREHDLPYERRTLSIALAGDREPRSWTTNSDEYTFYDLKGMIGAVMKRLGLGDNYISSAWQTIAPAESQANPALHPGRNAILQIGDIAVGYIGEVHPLVAERFEIEPPIRAQLAEIDLDLLMGVAIRVRRFRHISRYPAVRRDISLIFPADVQAQAIERVISEAGGDLLRDVQVVDVYHGENLGAGHKSVALSLEFQADNRTLTQEEVSALQDQIVEALARQLSGELRG